MAFRLKYREPLGCGTLRVYRQEAKAARKATRLRKSSDAAEQVHDLRKHLKVMRALLRLVRKQIGARRFQTENCRLRDTGRRLSALRDAEVRLRTFDALQERFSAGEERFPEIRAVFAREAAIHTEDAPDALAALATALKLAHRKGAALDAHRFGSRELRDALQRTYKKGRAALRAAQEEPAHERFHELRKRAKDLWYDVRLLQRAFPKVLKAQAQELKQLTTLLGESLDLTLLRTALAEETWKAGTALDRKQLGRWIDTRQDQLQRAALDLGEQFFAERPKKFAKQISGYCEEDRCGPADR